MVNYISKQKFLTRENRATLVDWMVGVQESFELNHETLYLAVKLVDMYLDRVANVIKDDLQLLAGTAIFIASKYDVSMRKFKWLNILGAITSFD